MTYEADLRLLEKSNLSSSNMRKISHVGFLSCAVHNMNDCFTLNDNDFFHLHEQNTVVILNREGCIEMIFRLHY